MKTKNKIILIIILLALTSYLIKTNKPKEESVEKVEIKSEPKKVFTMEEPEFWIEKLENKDDILMNSEKK